MNLIDNATQLFLQTAYDIGNQLASEALWHDKHCNWLGSATTSEVLVYKSQNASLYDGTIGIAYFLAGLYTEKPNKVFKNTIEGAMNHALDYYNRCGLPQNADGYNSIVGLMEVATVLQKENWMSMAKDLLKTHQLPEDQELFQLLEAFTSLVKLSKYSDFEFLNTILDTYIAKIDELCKGFQWNELSEAKQQSLDELSGAILGFLVLYEHTQNTQYLELARQGFVFIELQWQNNQFEGTNPSRALEASAYIKLYTMTDQGGYFTQLNELANYLVKSLEFSWGNLGHPQVNFSLQNGIISKIDSLLDIAQFLRNQYFENMAQHYGLLGVQQLAIPGLLWPSNRLDKQPCPGLMVGSAGIGYVYLRLFSLEKHQSVWNLRV